MSKASIHDYARMGAAARLAEIQLEIAAIREAFPELEGQPEKRRGRRPKAQTATSGAHLEAQNNTYQVRSVGDFGQRSGLCLWSLRFRRHDSFTITQHPIGNHGLPGTSNVNRGDCRGLSWRASASATGGKMEAARL
jgi:hypothetical protein